jgi:hypothetical protein
LVLLASKAAARVGSVVAIAGSIQLYAVSLAFAGADFTGVAAPVARIGVCRLTEISTLFIFRILETAGAGSGAGGFLCYRMGD